MSIKQVYAFYNLETKAGAGVFRFCPHCGADLVPDVGDGGKRRPRCPGCGYVQYRNPAPAVSVLVVEGDRCLLGRRSGAPGAGKWALPSGYVEWEDDFLSTGIQEVKEETGLDVRIESVLNVVSSFLSPQYHFLALFLLARVVGGEATAGDELTEIAWFPIGGPLPEMAFQEDLDMLASYAAGAACGLPADDRFASPLV